MKEIKLPDIKKGDTLLGGRFKNIEMEVEGFGKDEHNQPIVKTDKGDRKIFSFRLEKLMKQAILGDIPMNKIAYELGQKVAVDMSKIILNGLIGAGLGGLGGAVAAPEEAKLEGFSRGLTLGMLIGGAKGAVPQLSKYYLKGGLPFIGGAVRGASVPDPIMKVRLVNEDFNKKEEGNALLNKVKDLFKEKSLMDKVKDKLGM